MHAGIIFPFWNVHYLRYIIIEKIEKIDTSSKSPIEETIRKGSKTDNFEGKMLIFCMQRYFFHSGMYIYSEKIDTSSKGLN